MYIVIEGQDGTGKSTLLRCITGEETPVDLPKSNVLYFEMEDYAWCCVRPSGTEPKIKFYYGVKENSLEASQERLERLRQDLVSR